jgi:Domain of unknown function (DUF2760)
MKLYITFAGLLLAVLTGLLMIPSTNAYTFQIAAIAFVLALVVLVLSFVDASKKTAPEVARVQAQQPAVIQPPTPTPPDENAAEAEIVAFFALLQEKGRLVDFLMEDLASYQDAEIGAAARVVHEGCKQVLQEHFKIRAILEADEGSQVTVPAGFAADEYRFVGKLSGDPPFTGKLVHKGWKTDAVKLPRLVDARRLPAIAPAEVELESLKSKPT